MQLLTCASTVAVRDPGKAPVTGLTTVTADTADSWLARALTRHRVTRHTERTNHVALTETCHPSIRISFNKNSNA